MQSERHAEAKRLFDSVVDLPSDTQGEKLRSLSNDAELIRYVERLLNNAPTDASPKMASSVRHLLTALAQDELKVGDVLGAWKLVAEIGQGGMGKVFRAQRIDGHFEQQAAIKLLGGMPSAKALDYLARERQILATLVHPNIARLYDGASTESGQPYLVMELVEGISLDKYVDEQRLPLARRIRLLCEVCAAVEFAHQRLIIHCDLKPGNILVTPQGRPMLLDFGIARLLGAAPDEAMPQDGGAQNAPAGQTLTRAFTPLYASPEQVRGEPLTTATDVYSLGCLLRMLAGPQAAEGDLAAIIKRATHANPQRRYASAGDLSAELTRLLEHRPLEAREGNVLHGLRQHARRNWAWLSAGGLIAGTIVVSVVQVLGERDRALAAEQQAVAQRDETLAAQARVVAERNAAERAREEAVHQRDRATLAESAAATQRNAAQVAEREAVSERDRARAAQAQAQAEQRRAASAERQARQTNEFLVSIFDSSNPNAESGDVPTSKLLTAAEERLEKELADQPGAQAELFSAMGRVQANMGNTRQAIANYQKALALERKQDRPLVLAELLNRMALLRGANFGVAQAEPLARESLTLRKQYSPGDVEHVAESMTTLGNILTSRGQREESSRLLNEALALRESLNPNSAGVASSLHSLALHSQRFEAFDQAFEQFRRSLAVRKMLVGEGHPDHLITLEEYGNALSQARRYTEAEAVIRQALEHRKRLHGAGNEKVAFNLNVLGAILNRQGRQREAIKIYREALEIVGAKFGKRSMPYASVINNLAIPLQNSGDQKGAEQAYAEAMATFESIWPDDDLTLARVRYNVARIRTQTGDLAAAEAPLRRSLATRLKVLGDKHGDVLESRVLLGEWQAASKDYAAAEATIAGMLPLQPFKDPFTEVNFARLRALVAAAQGQRSLAQEQFLRSEEQARKAFGNNHPRALLVMRERMEWLARSQVAADQAEASALARDMLVRLGDQPELDAAVLARLRTLAGAAAAKPQGPPAPRP